MKRKLLFMVASLFIISYVYGVRVSPIRFDLKIAPGTSQEMTINISGSRGFASQDLMIYTSDLYMTRSGALLFDVRKSRNSCMDWIELETKRLSVFESEQKQVKFKVDIPYSATPGEYYAVIMVEPTEFSGVRDRTKPLVTQIKSRVAIVIVLDVPGRSYVKQGEIVDLKVLETDKLLKISSAFRNTGDIHLDVLAEATIRSEDGRVNYGKFDLNARASAKRAAFIFPDAIRDFEGGLERQLPAGNYMLEVSYDYGYKFRKANKKMPFTITRQGSVDESNDEFIALEDSKLSLAIPEGARRTEVVSVSNIDYRPLSIEVETPDWIRVVPKQLVLKPGESRNVMLIVSVDKYRDDQKKTALINFKADRGKNSVLSLELSSPQDDLGVKKDITHKTSKK